MSAVESFTSSLQWRSDLSQRSGLYLVLALLALAAQLPGQSRRSSASVVETGARLYVAHCSACHGADGNVIPGIDLRSGKSGRASSDEDLMRIVRGGIPGTAMPPNSFSDSDLEAIVGYIRSMRDVQPRLGPVGDARRGQIVFEGTSDCLTCHRVNDRGSFSAIDLSDIGTTRSTDYLERSLLDPNASDLPEHRLIHAITRDGVAITGRRLNEDTFTVQLIDDKGHLLSLLKPDLHGYEILRGPRMPSYKDKLSRRELDDVVSYLISLKGFVSK